MKRYRLALYSVAAIAGLWLIWQWGFCRFYVPPDHMAMVTAKTGEPLPAGQILAKPGQQGIQEQVLGEGRHFLNPLLYEHEIVPVITIPAGQVGVVISKIGAELPQGEFLAEPGQKGIWRGVLGPRKYRLNPYGYQVEVTDAISIPIGYVGVVTGLSGRQAARGDFAGPLENRVEADPWQPALSACHYRKRF